MQLFPVAGFGHFQTGPNLPEDEIISSLPDHPAHQDDYFHEKKNSQLLFEALENLQRIEAEVYL